MTPSGESEPTSATKGNDLRPTEVTIDVAIVAIVSALRRAPAIGDLEGCWRGYEQMRQADALFLECAQMLRFDVSLCSSRARHPHTIQIFGA
ncbi:hypothetical protein RRF57_002404 [Xylaria bambusicola]|uniref:Uncharacterized protein n=1 Tax=Xylaria bambusicola TaxID=326684 RepID=A0AAN7UEI5_9PEZI